MKKILLLFLILFLSLTSCSKSQHDNDNDVELSTKYYNVTWKVEDKIIKSERVQEGKIPKYNGEIPNKDCSVSNCFIFSHWDPTPSRIASDTTFNAVFTEKEKYYDITFNTLGGNPLNPISKPYGSFIDNIPNATKQGYIFTGWTLDIDNKIPVNFPYQINDNVTFYAAYNKQINNTDILDNLLKENNIDPLQFIPETIQKKSYTTKDTTSLNNDYLKETDIKTLNEKGYLQEWSFILDKIDQLSSIAKTEQGYNILNSQIIKAYNESIQQNPNDQNDFKQTIGNYTIHIKKIDNNFMLVFDQKTSQRLLTLDLVTGNKIGRLDNGENDLVKYTIKNNDFIFLIKKQEIYTYFHINKSTNNEGVDIIKGNVLEINETKTISSSFIINDKYASIIGNSHDKFYNEIYDIKTGKLISLIENNEINNIYFNIGDVTSFNTIQKDLLNQNNYLINGNEFIIDKNNNYNITLIDKYYITKNFFGTISVNKYKLPMIYVNENNINQLKDLIESNNKDLIFDLNVNVNDIIEFNDSLNIEIDKLSKLKNNLTKDEFLKQIGNKFIDNTTI